MKNISLIQMLLLSSVTACIAPHAALAEMVDYGSLQSLFGEPVTTSATGTPQRASDVPANMTIITADEIRQSGSRNIPEILSRVPGLDILQDSSTSFDVGVRGYQQPFQPRLLVLVDGRQVFIDDYSRTIWDNIPINIDDIRQIEVVKGASSALFGSNAAGGVINIITYSPIYDHNNVGSVSAGTQHTLTGDATVTKNGAWGGTKFSAGGLTADEFDTARVSGSDQIPTFEPRHRYVANSSVFQVTSDLQANTEFTYSDSVDNTIDGISYVTAAQHNTAWSARAGVTWQSPYGLITNNNYFNHSFTNFYEEPTSAGPYRLWSSLFVSQLQDEFKAGADHTFRLAIEYRHKDFTSSGVESIVENPDLAENNYAASGMWLWQMNDKLSWTNAVRVDDQAMRQNGTLAAGVATPASAYDRAVNAISGNSTFVYKATDIDTFRLGYGRGVELPSLIQSGFNQIFPFQSVPEDSEGNPMLKPTIVQDFSLDYERKINPVFSTLKLSPFYEINRDIAALQFSPAVVLGGAYTLFITENIGSSHALGGEIELKGSHEGYRWDASYSLAKVTENALVHTSLDYQGSAPESHFRLLLGYSTGPWEFDANGQYVTSLDMLRSTDGGLSSQFTPIGGYASLSGRIGYKIDERFTLALSGSNLTRANTQESAYPAVERQAFLTLTGHF
jgi:outer membrane receptor for ferrienterochelin and colicins